jgi:hypothetical protein
MRSRPQEYSCRITLLKDQPIHYTTLELTDSVVEYNYDLPINMERMLSSTVGRLCFRLART